jgi:hypothetical protein
MIIIGFKLGTKYQSLIDIMTARRISKLIDTANRLAEEKSDYQRYQRLEENRNGGVNNDY